MRESTVEIGGLSNMEANFEIIGLNITYMENLIKFTLKTDIK
jgi:hypothetical protein